jgi:hypothetical protein
VTTSAETELFGALARIAAQAEAGEPPDIAAELKAVPVSLRAAIAAAVLAGGDLPLNGVTLAAAAGFSRGTAYRTKREEVLAVLAAMPLVAVHILGRGRKGGSRSDALASLRQRDQTIANLRKAVTEAERDRDQALSYARDLHQQLEPEFNRILEERTAKVRHLRSLDAPKKPQDT